MFSPRESQLVENSTHPKILCEFFLLGMTLSFMNGFSCVGINGFFYCFVLSSITFILV
jgi:hypothetical protein